MAIVEAAADTHECKCCGYLYPESEGRKHGYHFMCKGCHNIENTIRRNLGDTSEMRSWDPEERKDFFQKLQKDKQAGGATILWSTVKAAMVTRLTERHMKTFANQVEAEELPLSVYLSRGWDEEVVKKFPCTQNTDYGCETYRVPVRKLTWGEAYTRMEEKLLEQEKHLKAKNKKAAEEQDLPLAEGGANTGSAGSEKRKRKRQRRFCKAMTELLRWLPKLWAPWRTQKLLCRNFWRKPSLQTWTKPWQL